MELLKAVFEEKCILMHLTPSLRQVHVEEKMKTKEIIKKIQTTPAACDNLIDIIDLPIK